jgi:hypothetical protein
MKQEMRLPVRDSRSSAYSNKQTNKLRIRGRHCGRKFIKNFEEKFFAEKNY